MRSHLALTTILGGRSYPHLTHEVTEMQRLSELTKVSEYYYLNSSLRPSNSMFFILYYIPALYFASLKVDMMLGFSIFSDFIVIIIIIKKCWKSPELNSEKSSFWVLGEVEQGSSRGTPLFLTTFVLFQFFLFPSGPPPHPLCSLVFLLHSLLLMLRLQSPVLERSMTWELQHSIVGRSREVTISTSEAAKGEQW